MKHRFKKKTFATGLFTLLCVPIALGSLTACKGGATEQTATEDSASVRFSDLSAVELSEPYAVNAITLELNYLLDTLDADKLLYGFYENARLPAKARSSYSGGWEGALIGGHTLGHYLSALAQAYASANTPAKRKQEVLLKIEYLINGLKECQDNAVTAGAKEGFLWGASIINASNPEIQFDNVEMGLSNIATQAWVPWYTMHKIIQGLLDVAVYTGNATARTVVEKLGDWVYNRVSQWSDSKKATVLSIEYGGMNDCMYSLFALTGNENYALAAEKFDEETLFSRILKAPANYLNNLHANTTIPKVLGALNRYVTCHDNYINGFHIDASEYLTVAEQFFDYVLEHHTYITGGNSEWEHFGLDDILNAERTNANCETCNTYNMLKLARTLFTITHDKKYLDYYENTYYNAIWSSQNPETGMTTYFQPMATGYFKVYSSEENHFWCCTGSGMESMTKLNDSIYYEAGNAVYVSLYLDSTYTSDEVTLKQEASLETSDSVSIKVKKGSTILRLRRPDWTEQFQVTVNKNVIPTTGEEDFVSVEVKKGDTVKVDMKKTVQAYNLPDGENVYAFRYGPFVLSAELGTERMTQSTTGVNVSIPASAIGNQVYSVKGANLTEYMNDIGSHMTKTADNKFVLECENGTLTYSYHFRQYQQRYGIYFEFTTGEVAEVEKDYEWIRSDTVQPGYGQYETDALHNLQDNGSEGATNVETLGTTRKALANGSFSYRMVVNPSAENRLVVTFAKADNGKTISVKAGDTKLYEATLSYNGTQDVYDVEIPIPETVAKAAETTTYTDASGGSVSTKTITLTFSGIGGAESARLCTFIYSEYLENHLAYFVDCGDYNPFTVSDGEMLGTYQSVTEQIYGTDPTTGRNWGLVDNYATNIAGTASNGIYTNSTWAYEFSAGDNVASTETNRYTKNQYENGVSRNLHYTFDLEDGTYLVKVFFSNPWSCSSNPCVSANGTEVITNGATGQELTFTVTVTNGELVLDFTSSDLCINLCYIKILFTE